jgi:hypothetical protein
MALPGGKKLRAQYYTYKIYLYPFFTNSFQGNCLSLISLPSPLGEGYGGEAFFSPLG